MNNWKELKGYIATHILMMYENHLNSSELNDVYNNTLDYLYEFGVEFPINNWDLCVREYVDNVVKICYTNHCAKVDVQLIKGVFS